MAKNLSEFLNNVKKSFSEFDIFLQNCKISEQKKNALFVIRTNYAYHRQLNIYLKSKESLLITLGSIVTKLVKLLFFKTYFHYDTDTIILHYSSKDQKIADQLGICCPPFKIKFSLSAKRCLALFSIIQIFFIVLLTKRINRKQALLVFGGVIDYFAIYSSIKLDGIKTIITENDITSKYVAIIIKAKQLGIKTIKFETCLIDDLFHNNVLCEYYYYPGNYYKNIRRKFDINLGLKYIEGGFLHLDPLNGYSLNLSQTESIISYFTSHSNVSGEADDVFYIDEILSVMNQQQYLYIKVHPRDDIQKYQKYTTNEKCKILTHKDIDNYVLICRSNMCFSIFSTLSFEAKHIQEKSYLINYFSEENLTVVDYEKLADFIDIVKNRQTLSKVIAGKYPTITKSKFIKQFNTKFPRTVEHFKSVFSI